MADINPQILITAKDEASKVLKNLSTEAKNTSQSFKDQLEKSTVGLTAAFAGVTAIAVSSIKAFSDSQNAVAQLNAVLTSTKGAAGLTAAELTKMASALQQQSKFDDEAIIGAQSLLLTFTKIGKEVFPDATQTVLDMSQALGQDLKSSSVQLGKALNDPIQGVTALRRVGVSFNEEQLKQIKTMQESGNLMGAQKLILRELATEFGGSASAAAKTFDGQITILKNNLNDLQETIGSGLLTMLSSLTGGKGLEGVNNAILNFNKLLQENKLVLAIVSGVILGLVVGLGGLLLAALIAAAGAASLFVAAAAAISAVLGALAVLIITNWSGIVTFFQGVGTSITQIFTGIGNFFVNTWAAITSGFTAFGQAFMGAVEAFFKGIATVFLTAIVINIAIWDTLTGGMITNLIKAIPAIIGYFQNLWAQVTEIFNSIVSTVKGLWTGFTSFLTTKTQAATSAVIQGFNAIVAPISQAWNNAASTVSNALNSIWYTVTSVVNSIRSWLNANIPTFRISLELPDVVGFIRNKFNQARALLPRSLQSLVPQFATGGIVSGAIGQPQLALVHGGEEIKPHTGSGTGGDGGSLTLNVNIGLYAGTPVEKRRIAETLYRELAVMAKAQNKNVQQLMGA